MILVCFLTYILEIDIYGLYWSENLDYGFVVYTSA
jgi:hypothetical protein